MPQVTYNELDVAGVYIILHTASGKTYVGEAVNIRKRWIGHFKALNKNQHGNTYLQNAWNKYGVEAFEFKVFLTITENLSPYFLKRKLKQEEVRILKLFPNHYNLTEAGEGCMIFSDESKKKMGVSIKANWENNVETVLKHKAAIRAAWQDPAVKASRVASFNTEEGKKNRAEGAAKGWLKRKEKLATDAEFLRTHKEARAKANGKIKELYNTQERKEQLSKQSLESWKVEGRKEKVSTTLRQFYKDPENRKRHSKIMKEAYKKD